MHQSLQVKIQMNCKFLNCRSVILPWAGIPPWARMRVQCSDMFIMTSGWSDTVTDGTTLGLAITLLDAAVAVDCDDDFEPVAGGLVEPGAALLVDASSILSSVSTSIRSFDAVTGIFLFNQFALTFRQNLNQFRLVKMSKWQNVATNKHTNESIIRWIASVLSGSNSLCFNFISFVRLLSTNNFPERQCLRNVSLTLQLLKLY